MKMMLVFLSGSYFQLSQKFVENSQNVSYKINKSCKVLVPAGRLSCHVKNCVCGLLIARKRDVITTIQTKKHLKFGIFHNTFRYYLLFLYSPMKRILKQCAK